MNEKPFQPLEQFTEGTIGGFAKIEQMKMNSNLLVKEITFLSTGLTEHYTFEEFEREVTQPIAVLKELGFDKFIPSALAVWGKNERGVVKGYVVMEKVHGVDI